MKLDGLFYDDLSIGMLIETPKGESRITSYGGSGFKNDKSIFVNLDNGYHYSTKHGLETNAEQKTREWAVAYDGLSKTCKSIIEFQFPDLLEKDFAGLKQPDIIYNMSVRRTVKAGIIEWETCSRCGGTGHHSYCSQYGTTCFKCGGKKVMFPSATKILKAIILNNKKLRSV